MQISRLFEVLYILMRKSTVTAKELAEHFEVSQRTIYRDIDTLALAGFPVYTCKGKGGGIRLVEDFVLSKSILSEKEQSEILTALQGLNAVRGEETDNVIGKLSALFNKNTENWLEVDFTDWSFSNGDRFHNLKTAILEKRVVEFDYYSSYGEKTHRRIEPAQLWFKHRAWYIKGFCLIKNDLRVFKLSRTRNVAVTNEVFAPRCLISATESNLDEKRVREDITLKLRISPEMAYRVYDEFDEEQTVKNDDGSYTVTVTWPEDEWVYGFILSFGEYVEVLEPAHIRGKLQKKLQKSLKKYL